MAGFSGIKKIGMPACEAQPGEVRIEAVASGALYKAMNTCQLGEAVEGIYTIVGVLGANTLPPMGWDKVTAAKPVALSQRLTLYGMDTPAFEQAVDFISTVDFHFAETIVPPVKTFMAPSVDGSGRGKGLDMDTRFFTRDRKPIPLDMHHTFSSLVDPIGALKALETPNLAHCVAIDNVVHYLAMKGGKIAQQDPEAFAEGDIVEVGFACIPGAFERNRTILSGKAGTAFCYTVGPAFYQAAEAALQNRKRKHLTDANKEQDCKWKSIKSSTNPLADMFAAGEDGEAEWESESEEVQETCMELEDLHLAAPSSKTLD
ncbi:hypothetical protein C8F01DRAFT_1369722 [Mycena amicta]|nr:hypothetical protein C8F01DRAFT_1369722 [Mycena amicta]